MVVYYGEFCLSGWLSGMGESRANFRAQGINALATLLIALPAGAIAGVRGIILGAVIAGTCSLIAQLWVSIRFMGFPARDQPAK